MEYYKRNNWEQKVKSSNLPAQIVIENIEHSEKITIAEKFNDFFVNIGPNLASKIKSSNNSFKSYLSDIQSELKYKKLLRT